MAFAAFQTPQQALELLGLMRGAMGDRFTAFELMSNASVAMVKRYFPATPALFSEHHPWHVLMQASDGGEQAALDSAFQAALKIALERGIIDDVMVATSEAQAKELWKVRENISQAQQHDGGNIKHDIAVPVSSVPAFIDEVLPLLHAAYAGVRPIVYGHLGDGNLHFNASGPASMSAKEWQAETDRVNVIVFDVVARMQGSFSAEHGLGQLKNHEMALYKTPLEIDVMRRVKNALDPKKLMNPGKFLPN